MLRRVVADGTPLAPVHAATHAQLTSIECGRAAARMPTTPGDGLLEPLLVLADFALGVSYSSTLAAGDRIVTVRLGVELLGRPSPGDELAATAQVDDAHGGVGLSSALVTGRDGRPIARCSGRNAVLSDELAHRYGRTAPAWPARPTPWRLLMPHRGEDPTRDGTTMIGHPDPTSLNSAGVVQGGALAGLAARGLGHTLDVVPDDFSVSFVRPVRTAGQPVMCRVVVEHGGRRLKVGRAELVDEHGRLFAVATGTAWCAARS